MAIGHTRTGHELFRREQAPLREELADRQRAFRDTRFGSIHKVNELKRDQEFRLEEFSRRRMVENHFKDVESVRSESISHVPSQPALFPLLREPERLLIRDYNLQPNIWDTHFCKSTSVLFDNLFRNAQSLDFSITGNIPVQASTGRPVIENGDRDNSHSRAPNG